MKAKKVCYSELSYVFGIIALALGTALIEVADFGMSMIVAPAYLLHLKISQYFSWFSFGMAEYCLQAVLIILSSLIMHRFKMGYLFSFITAIVYGLVLDLCIMLVGFIPLNGIVYKIACFVIGVPMCSVGVAFMFHTYIAPEAYELLVKEVSDKYKFNVGKVKTFYDCSSCVVSIVLSFVFFGFWQFKGIGFGTVFCAFVNGWLLTSADKILNKLFEFKDAFKFRKYFEK